MKQGGFRLARARRRLDNDQPTGQGDGADHSLGPKGWPGQDRRGRFARMPARPGQGSDQVLDLPGSPVGSRDWQTGAQPVGQHHHPGEQVVERGGPVDGRRLGLGLRETAQQFGAQLRQFLERGIVGRVLYL